MKNKSKKYFSFLLALLLVFGLFPAATFAAPTGIELKSQSNTMNLNGGSYYLAGDVTITGANGAAATSDYNSNPKNTYGTRGYDGIKITGTVTIDLNGHTLTVKGGNGGNATDGYVYPAGYNRVVGSGAGGGGAGIYLPSGATLVLIDSSESGGGKVIATGGKGGNAGSGTQGVCSNSKNEGYGGFGGGAGGGGGAGIGGYGGRGGHGNPGRNSSWSSRGEGVGESGATMGGTLRVLGVTIEATGGAGGSTNGCTNGAVTTIEDKNHWFYFGGHYGEAGKTGSAIGGGAGGGGGGGGGNNGTSKDGTPSWYSYTFPTYSGNTTYLHVDEVPYSLPASSGPTVSGRVEYTSGSTINTKLGSAIKQNDKPTSCTVSTWYALVTNVEFWDSVANVKLTDPATLSVDDNEVPVIPEAPVKPGYTFGKTEDASGWYKERDCVAPFDFATPRPGVGGTEQAWAKFIPNPYTVTFNGNGGTVGGESGSYVQEGFVYDALPKALSGNAFTKTGYTFANWKTEDGSKTYTDGAEVKNLATEGTANLYAVWEAESYSVTLDNGVGSGANSTTATYDSGMAAVAVPTRAGYAFNGYYSGENGSGEKYYNSDGTSAKIYKTPSEMTLYARWTSLRLQTEGIKNVTVKEGNSAVTGKTEGEYTYYPIHAGSEVTLGAEQSVLSDNVVFLGWLGETSPDCDGSELAHSFTFPESAGIVEFSMAGRSVAGTWSEDVLTLDTSGWPPEVPPVYRKVTVETYLNGEPADMGAVTLADGAEENPKPEKTMQRVGDGVYEYTAENDADTTYKVLVGGEETGKTLQFTESAEPLRLDYAKVTVTTRLDGSESDGLGIVYLKKSDGTTFATPQRAGEGVYEDVRLLGEEHDNAEEYHVFTGDADTGFTVRYRNDGTGNTLATVDYYTATVSLTEDGEAYSPTSVTLRRDDEITKVLTGSEGSYSGAALSGTYDIYVDGEDSGKDIALSEAKSLELQYFTVSYAVSGGETGTLPAQERYIKDSIVTVKPLGTLAKEGYAFSGWADPDGTLRRSGSEFKLVGAKTFTATWSATAAAEARWTGDGKTWVYGTLDDLVEAYDEEKNGLQGVLQNSAVLSTLDMELDANESLEIASDMILIVTEGRSVSNSGKIKLSGTIGGEGKLVNTGTVEGGTLAVAETENNDGTLNGVTVDETASVKGGTVDGGINRGTVDGAEITGKLVNIGVIKNAEVNGTVENNGMVLPSGEEYPASGTGSVTAAGGSFATAGKTIAEIESQLNAAFGGMASASGNAADGYTVKLLGNTILGASFEITDDITFDLNGYTLMGAKGVSAIEITGGTLSIDNGGVSGGEGASGISLSGKGSAVIGKNAMIQGGNDGIHAEPGSSGTVKNSGQIIGGTGDGIETPESFNVFNLVGGSVAGGAEGTGANCGTIFNLGGTIVANGRDVTAPYAELFLTDAEDARILQDSYEKQINENRDYPWNELVEGVSFAAGEEEKIFRFDGEQTLQAKVTARSNDGAEAAATSVKKYLLSDVQYDVYQLAALGVSEWTELPEDGKITVPEETDAIVYLYLRDANGNAAVYSTDGLRTSKPLPEGLTSKPETVRETTHDGAIGGTIPTEKYQYKYKALGEDEWSDWMEAAEGEAISGLTAGDYIVVFKPSEGKTPGTGTAVTVEFTKDNRMLMTHTLAGLSATEDTVGEGKAIYWEEYTTTLTALPGYALPEKISVIRTQDGGEPAELASGTDYSYSQTGENAGKVTVSGTSVTGDITIIATAAPAINSQPQNALAVAGNEARFTVSASGFAPLSYQWQKLNGEAWEDLEGAEESIFTTGKISSANAGDKFRCVVIDVNGRRTISDTAELGIAEEPTVGITGKLSVGFGEETELSAEAMQGVAPYTYLWSTGETTEKILVSPAGTTSYTVTVRDALGNTCTDTKLVAVAQPVRTIAVTPASYTFASSTAGYAAAPEAFSFTIKNTGGAPVNGYRVTADGSFTATYTSGAIAKDGESTFTVRPKEGLAAGVYRATVNVTTTEGTSEDVTATFTVNPAPVVNISGNTAVAVGESTMLSAEVIGGTEPYSYLWSNGETAASVSVSPESAATYTVTVMDGSGKTAFASASVKVQTIPAVYAIFAEYGGENSGNFGTMAVGYNVPAAQSVTLTNTGNRNVTIIPPESISFTVTLAGSSNMVVPGGSTTYNITPKAGLQAGSYAETLTFTAEQGADASVTAAFTVNRELSVSIGGIIRISAGGSTTLTAHPAGGSGSYTYEWSKTGDETVTGSGESFEASAAGEYSVKVTDSENNTATDTVTVTSSDVNLTVEQESLLFAPVTVKADGSYVLPEAGSINAESSDPTVKISAETENDSAFEVSDGLAVLPKNNLPVGTHRGTVKVKANGSDYAVIPVTFTVNPAPVVSISGNTVVIPGGSTVLTASAFGGTGSYTYDWGAAGNGQSITVSPAEDKEYTVIVTDERGMTASAEVNVTVAAPSHKISAAPAIIDFGGKSAGYSSAPGAQTVTITNSGNSPVTGCTVTGGRNIFEVVYDDEVIAPAGTSAVLLRPKKGLPAGVYSEKITVETAEGVTASFIATFKVNPPPAVSIAGDISIVKGESTTLTASASGGTGGYTYKWNTGETAASNMQAPAASTTYTVTATDESGISTTAKATVRVAEHSYTIGVSQSAADFARQTVGYASVPAAQTIVISNTGDDVLQLTEIKSSREQSNFILSLADETLESDIAPGETKTFAVQPKSGLAVGTYGEIITIKTNKGTSAAVAVRFQVVNAPTVAINGPKSLGPGKTGRLTAVVTDGAEPFAYLWSTGETSEYIDVTGHVDTTYTVIVTDASGKTAQSSATVLADAENKYSLSASPYALRFSANTGYTVLPAAQTVTVTNTGNSELTLEQPLGNENFTVGTLSALTLPAAAKATFTVQPTTTGLAAETYSFNITLATDHEGTQANVRVSFSVARIPAGSQVLPITPPVTPPVSQVEPVSPTAPSGGYEDAIGKLPEPSADITLNNGGIGKPEAMSDSEYVGRLDDIISEIEALSIGHLDAPLDTSELDRDGILKAEALYQAVWAQKAPDMLNLLDLETGTKTVSEAYEDNKVPVLVAEYIFEGEDYQEALEQVSEGTKIAVINVSLMLDGVEIQPNGSIEITFFFKEYRGQPLTICHKLADGTWEQFEVTVDEKGYASVTAESLSPFVIAAGSPTEAPGSDEAPGAENINGAPEETASGLGWLWLPIAAGVIGISALIWLLVRQKRKQNEV